MTIISFISLRIVPKVNFGYKNFFCRLSAEYVSVYVVHSSGVMAASQFLGWGYVSALAINKIPLMYTIIKTKRSEQTFVFATPPSNFLCQLISHRLQCNNFQFCRAMIRSGLCVIQALNFVNYDKIQNYYGYHRYYPFGNKYITCASNTKYVFITTSG